MLRVSTEEQSHGESLTAQKSRLYDLAEKQGFAKKEIKVFEIVESSTIGARKKFYEMIDWVKSQKESICLFVEAIDRLQRGFKESVLIDDLRLLGKIEIHFYKEGIVISKNSTNQELMMWDFSVIGAKMYVQNISHNVRRSNESKLRKGEILGVAPLGYINSIDINGNKTVVVDPDRGHFMRKAFNEYAKGIYSLTDIKKMLEKEGLRSKKGKVVSKSALHQRIQDPFYIGIMTYKGKEHPHYYEKLIEKPIFDKCQEVRLSYGKKPFKYAKKPFPFRGILQCAHCGCTITTEEKKGHRYLFCSKYKGECGQKRVKEEDLMQDVEKAFKAIQIPKDILEELQKRLEKSVHAKKQYQCDVISTLDKEYKKNQQRLDVLLEIHLDQSITKDEYNKKSFEIRQRQEEILDEKKLHNDADGKFAITLSYLLTLASKAYEIFKSSKVEEKRELMSFLLWNPRLEHGKLLYNYKKPFDLLERASMCQEWLPRLDSNQ